MIRVGSLLYGYCGGEFGRDSYGTKRVEAIGADWIVVRDVNEQAMPVFAVTDPNDLERYTVEEEG